MPGQVITRSSVTVADARSRARELGRRVAAVRRPREQASRDVLIASEEQSYRRFEGAC